MAVPGIEVSGQVARQNVDIGSKSARDAVVLHLDDGTHYVLRNGDAPSFGDHSLDHLVGKAIKAQGTAVGKTLILKGWETLPEGLGKVSE